MNLIKTLKLGLYSPSMIVVILAWDYSGFRNLQIFLLLMFLVLFFQMGINLEMDYRDYITNVPVSNKDTLFPSGPYSIIEEKLKPDHVKILSFISFSVSVILGVTLLIIVKNIELLYIGLLAIFVGLIYLTPPIELYKRGLGEISTFLDFGPILMAGSMMSLNGFITLKAIIASIGLGLQTSSIRFIHHIVDENQNTFRVQNFRWIYGILLLSSFIPLLFINLFEILPGLLSIAHIIYLPKDYKIASRKTWITLLLQLLTFLLLL